MVLDASLRLLGFAQQELTQHYPLSGLVEHDAEEIWTSTLNTVRAAIADAKLIAADIAAIGITNQRETTIVWDRRTGRPIHHAIVWQDRRTAKLCRELADSGLEPLLSERTGLRLDPYFSASKIAWLLDHVPGAREAAQEGHLAFGTVDCWLLYRLTGGKAHATDATNAARTALLDIHRGVWDEDLLEAFRIPACVLPEVKDSDALFGTADPSLFGAAIPIRGIAGDQQAATMGQACFRPGMMKSTYGTGCFALLNTGHAAVASRHRLLTTIAYQLGGKRTYALEGAIFIAGAAVQWLRDGLKIIPDAAATGSLAKNADPGQDVLLVPAFVGLGAPYWQPEARGALFGLTRATGPAELARAALQSTAFQTRDLLEAMRGDWPARDWPAGGTDTVLRVDGGMVQSDVALQMIADTIGARVERPVMRETTALGAAWLAGKGAGLLPEQAGFAEMWRLDRRFEPMASREDREHGYGRWKRAVEAVIGFAGTGPD